MKHKIKITEAKLSGNDWEELTAHIESQEQKIQDLQQFASFTKNFFSKLKDAGLIFEEEHLHANKLQLVFKNDETSDKREVYLRALN